ncbi:MAG: 5-(carboxyamino)imidazole ribonucleotide mutase [Candidatus Margulisbacteria bacterium]|nr:5-(carboxyamino)imidazole ribonucleotide mutase [Candidatus Margulisiibacteriota bacterium]
MILIIMGSKSDAEVMSKAEDQLKEFGLDAEVVVASAHRNPEKVSQVVTSGKYDVIIAGAGKAAHLPGVIAGQTITPVIGVPIKTSDLGGMDSLLSIVQMPSGVPVATVAINGAQNAAILAAQIVALKDAKVKKALESFKESLKK